MTRQKASPLVVLGSGYTGRLLHRTGTSQGWTVHATSRNLLNNLAGVHSEQRLRFDLEQPSTWLNIPAGADLIWCFPATPLEQVQAFARTLDAPPRRMVVLGSTSTYEVADLFHRISSTLDRRIRPDRPDQAARPGRGISATAPWRHRTTRGRHLRTGAESAWIGSDKGRVGLSRKYVNLIHVEDLAAICLACAGQGEAR